MWRPRSTGESRTTVASVTAITPGPSTKPTATPCSQRARAELARDYHNHGSELGGRNVEGVCTDDSTHCRVSPRHHGRVRHASGGPSGKPTPCARGLVYAGEKWPTDPATWSIYPSARVLSPPLRAAPLSPAVEERTRRG